MIHTIVAKERSIENVRMIATAMMDRRVVGKRNIAAKRKRRSTASTIAKNRHLEGVVTDSIRLMKVIRFVLTIAISKLYIWNNYYYCS